MLNRRTEGDEKTEKLHGWGSKYVKCLYSHMPADKTCTDGADCVSALVALQSVLIISVCVLSWLCWLNRSQTRRFLFAMKAIPFSWWNSQTYAYSFGLIFYS